jgi:hypothetical protein
MMRRAAQTGAVVFVVLAAMADVGGSGATRLEVRTGSGRLLWGAPIAFDEPFDVAFTHSVERTRWTQHYRAGHGDIQQDGSTFTQFGAGVPTASADGSALLVTADGYYARAPLTLSAIPMLNSRAAGITLRYRDRLVPISNRLPDFDPLEIRVR